MVTAPAGRLSVPSISFFTLSFQKIRSSSLQSARGMKKQPAFSMWKLERQRPMKRDIFPSSSFFRIRLRRSFPVRKIRMADRRRP